MEENKDIFTTGSCVGLKEASELIGVGVSTLRSWILLFRRYY